MFLCVFFNRFYEIQTKNLAKLLPKILDTIEKGHNVKLVHPIPLINRIELKDEDGTLISKRKSPKKGCIYDIFRELTGIYPLIYPLQDFIQEKAGQITRLFCVAFVLRLCFISRQSSRRNSLACGLRCPAASSGKRDHKRRA